MCRWRRSADRPGWFCERCYVPAVPRCGCCGYTCERQWSGYQFGVAQYTGHVYCTGYGYCYGLCEQYERQRGDQHQRDTCSAECYRRRQLLCRQYWSGYRPVGFRDGDTISIVQRLIAYGQCDRRRWQCAVVWGVYDVGNVYGSGYEHNNALRTGDERQRDDYNRCASRHL